MMELIRATDAEALNAIVNNPAIYPLVHGVVEGPMDLSPIVANPENHVLIAEHGAVVFAIRQIGLYEMTVTVLPGWRDEWAMRMVKSALEWAFTHTSAIEIYVRAPDIAPGAYPFAQALGFVFEFTSSNGWIYEAAPTSAAVLSLKIQDWMRTAPDLSGAAQSFHASMAREFQRSGREDYVQALDGVRDRYIGAAAKMIQGGQPHKGVIFYNRFAMMMGLQPIGLLGVDPVVLEISGMHFEAHGRNFFLVSPASESIN